MAYQNSPRIITNGLVLCLDAGNTKSYPGSGTTWRDISNTGNNGTLVYGPSFDSTNGGNIVFDGVNDHVSLTIAAGLTSTLTVITIGKSTNSTWNNYCGLGSCRTSNGYLIHNDINATTVSFYVLNSSGTYTGLGASSPSNIQNYNMYTFSTNGSNSHKGYVNDRLQVTSSSAITRTNTNSSQNVYLGLDDNGQGRYNAMSIALHLMYNRELTYSEILQNYNAIKSRFGL